VEIQVLDIVTRTATLAVIWEGLLLRQKKTSYKLPSPKNSAVSESEPAASAQASEL